MVINKNTPEEYLKIDTKHASSVSGGQHLFAKFIYTLFRLYYYYRLSFTKVLFVKEEGV